MALITASLWGDIQGDCFYRVSETGTLALTYTPHSLPEKKIKYNIEQGHRSELYISYRVKLGSEPVFSLKGMYQEVEVRRSGYRDKITGNYILLLNGREIAVYSEWPSFFKHYSSSLVYPSRISIQSDQQAQVKVRFRVIYKKLVPPFSMMYIIPGKFMHIHPWQNVSEEVSH